MLDDLFDIANADALVLMSTEEKKHYLKISTNAK